MKKLIVVITIFLYQTISANDEIWYMLTNNASKCEVSSNINGVDMRPGRIAGFDGCKLDTQHLKEKGILIVDCEENKQLKTTFLYTKTINDCAELIDASKKED